MGRQRSQKETREVGGELLPLLFLFFFYTEIAADVMGTWEAASDLDPSQS